VKSPLGLLLFANSSGTAATCKRDTVHPLCTVLHNFHAQNLSFACEGTGIGKGRAAGRWGRFPEWGSKVTVLHSRHFPAAGLCVCRRVYCAQRVLLAPAELGSRIRTVRSLLGECVACVVEWSAPWWVAVVGVLPPNVNLAAPAVCTPPPPARVACVVQRREVQDEDLHRQRVVRAVELPAADLHGRLRVQCVAACIARMPHVPRARPRARACGRTCPSHAPRRPTLVAGVCWWVGKPGVLWSTSRLVPPSSPPPTPTPV
jgi:hypothetical protein